MDTEEQKNGDTNQANGEEAKQEIQQEEQDKSVKKDVFKVMHYVPFTFALDEYEIEKKDGQNEILDQIIQNKLKIEQLVADRCEKKNEDITKIADYIPVSMAEFYVKHHDRRHPSVDDEKCVICMFEFFDDVEKIKYDELIEDLQTEKDEDIIKLEHCDGHFFHIGCIKNYLATQTSDFIRCPVCSRIYGVMTGDQPKGTFESEVEEDEHCAGFDDCGTIIINYHFPSGKQPNGRQYWGTSRTAFLPDNEEGRECLRLLKLSFDRRLTFTIGTSVTTGRSDCVIWNGIHHKTNTHGGPTSFGYPDKTYFNRLKLELAAKGVE